MGDSQAKPEKFILHCPDLRRATELTCAEYSGMVITLENKKLIPPHHGDCFCVLVPLKSQADYNNEMIKCNSGHSTPRYMWDCPHCTQAITRENHELKEDLKVATQELKDAQEGLSIPGLLIKHIDHKFPPNSLEEKMTKDCHQVMKKCYAYFRHIDIVINQLNKNFLKRK